MNGLQEVPGFLEIKCRIVYTYMSMCICVLVYTVFIFPPSEERTKNFHQPLKESLE